MGTMMWLLVLTLSIWSSKTEGSHHLTASDQLFDYKMEIEGYASNLTDDNGTPVDVKDVHEMPTELVDNPFLLNSLIRLSSERIPARSLHAKGTGAFGYFKVTKDISDICKAKVFSKKGKETKCVVRMSNHVGDQGSPDTLREPTGFSVKFYTEEGNFDLVGMNFPVFDIKNPTYFSSQVHSLKRNPQTKLLDMNARWDFITSRPESILFAMFNYGDEGIVDGYRHIKGYPIHTYQLYNDKGNVSYVRFRFEPDAGVANLNSSEAVRLAGEDPDYYTRDLYEAILNGNYPSWTLSIQHMCKDEVANTPFNPFDVTLMWPEKQYPHKPIGKLILNENLKNHFAENEQLSFCPGNLVPGISGGSDKMFEARRFTYQIAARHRLGSNFQKITVNCPIMNQAHTYNRDGNPPTGSNGGDAPNYFTNSFYGPQPTEDKYRPHLYKPYVDPAARNYGQARDLYENGLTEAQRKRLAENIVNSLTNVKDFIKKRAINMFKKVHPDLGQMIKDGTTHAPKKNPHPVPLKD